jgi:hypothetical protein
MNHGIHGRKREDWEEREGRSKERREKSKGKVVGGGEKGDNENTDIFMRRKSSAEGEEILGGGFLFLSCLSPRKILMDGWMDGRMKET